MAEQGRTDREAWEGEMFRLLAENVKDYAIFVVDPHRHVLSWSKGAERLLGFSEGEIVGSRCDRFFTPEDVERGVPQQELEQALATGRGEDDRWHMRKDGSRFWASGAVTPLKDGAGRLRGFAKIMRDRTEMKRAEEEAHERERQLQLLTDHAPVLIAHCDADRRFEFVNKPYAARFGLHPRDVAGRPIRDVLGTAAYAAVERHVDAVLAGERVEFEAEVPYEGSGTQVVRCAYDPEFDADGRVVGFVAAIVNVTDGRRAREELRESEERLRTLSDNLPHGAVYQVLGDREGRRRFTHVSAGVEGLFGVTPAEAMADAAALYGLVHEGDRGRVAAAEEVALRDLSPFDCEFRSYTRSGDLRWVHARSAPRRLPNGQTVWDGIVMDVTEWRRAERESRASRDRLDLVVNSVDVGLWYCDLPFDKLVWNARVKEHFGLPADYDVTIDTFYERLHPDDRERTRRAIEASIRDRTGYDIEYRTVGLDGRERWVRAIGRTFYGPWGEPVRFDGITVDVTERVRQQEALKDADRRKDEFLAMLAHELRNPLAPIRNAAQVVRLLGTPDPNLRRSSELIERQVQAMTRLVDDLLDVSRITTGKIKLQKESVGLAAVVARAVETARPLIEARRHELTVTLPPEAVTLEADATRLAQVLGNLLTNAAKYSEEGGRIELAVEPHGNMAVVRVRDTGVGIAPEMLGKVFDLFTQVDRSLARSEGGLGIGLTLVQRLVEMHGGNVEAKSEGPGKGSEFVVRLPVRETPPAPQADHVERGRDRPSPPRRVLVVDDNKDAAESLAMLLRAGGHEVRTAHDGPTALRVAEAFRPEVVLLDLGLPGMDGFEVARRLRERAGREDALRLIALTGYGQEEDKRRAAESGFDEHLTKPADFAALRRLLAASDRNA